MYRAGTEFPHSAGLTGTPLSSSVPPISCSFIAPDSTKLALVSHHLSTDMPAEISSLVHSCASQRHWSRSKWLCWGFRPTISCPPTPLFLPAVLAPDLVACGPAPPFSSARSPQFSRLSNHHPNLAATMESTNWLTVSLRDGVLIPIVSRPGSLFAAPKLTLMLSFAASSDLEQEPPGTKSTPTAFQIPSSSRF